MTNRDYFKPKLFDTWVTVLLLICILTDPFESNLTFLDGAAKLESGSLFWSDNQMEPSRILQTSSSRDIIIEVDFSNLAALDSEIKTYLEGESRVSANKV